VTPAAPPLAPHRGTTLASTADPAFSARLSNHVFGFRNDRTVETAARSRFAPQAHKVPGSIQGVVHAFYRGQNGDGGIRGAPTIQPGPRYYRGGRTSTTMNENSPPLGAQNCGQMVCSNAVHEDPRGCVRSDLEARGRGTRNVLDRRRDIFPADTNRVFLGPASSNTTGGRQLRLCRHCGSRRRGAGIGASTIFASVGGRTAALRYWRCATRWLGRCSAGGFAAHTSPR